MKTIRYWYTDDEDFEYNILSHEWRCRVRTLLSYDDKYSLIDFIMDYVSEDDLFEYFEDEIKDYFKDDAMEWYREHK